MENNCSISPSNKKEYLTDIGKILVNKNGKKEFYKPVEVKEAHQKSKWFHYLKGSDFSCWAMCTFSSQNDFEKYHEQTGEICDYGAMKLEMLNGISGNSISSWTEIPDFNIEASWLDLGNIFEGIGEFITGIFD